MDALLGRFNSLFLSLLAFPLFSGRPVVAWSAVTSEFDLASGFGSHLQHCKAVLAHIWAHLVPFDGRGKLTTSTYIVASVGLTMSCGLGSALYLWHQQKVKQRLGSTIDEKVDKGITDPSSSEPGLFQKHSTIQSYHVPATGFTYPQIRTFHLPHPQGTKLPQKPCPIPLLVFIHGLGGSCPQFHAILKSLVDIAPTLAIDLPGCGHSSFKPTDWKAYTADALVQLLAVVIEAHRDRNAGQGVVLVGHSYGTSLSALLASSTSPHAALLSEHVLGFVAICPALPPDEKHTKAAKLACYTPGPIFDMVRRRDRKGGINSVSVARMAGPDADAVTKTLQLKFNKESRTPVWQRMMYGAITNPSTGNFPGESVWYGLRIPLLLLGGESDTVTPVSHINLIVHYLGLDVAHHVPSASEKMITQAFEDFNTLPTRTDSAASTSELAPHPRTLSVKSIIFPKPAAHALLYAPTTSRILSALISKFLQSRVDPRLSAAWQLHYLNTSSKWDVKNLEKWKAVPAVSAPIANTFRAMKTLREVDERHTPRVFVTEYGRDGAWYDSDNDGDGAGRPRRSNASTTTYIRAVIDISRESPVYNPQGLEEGGIRYSKFPTVSKLPPTEEEVAEFVALVDRVRDEVGGGPPTVMGSRGQRDVGGMKRGGLIGVHCHYGFNRTGFFLVCYMVERLGYSVEDAIAEFKRCRAPGIKHAHFVDALHVRYFRGLQRAPTL